MGCTNCCKSPLSSSLVLLRNWPTISMRRWQGGGLLTDGSRVKILEAQDFVGWVIVLNVVEVLGAEGSLTHPGTLDGGGVGF